MSVAAASEAATQPATVLPAEDISFASVRQEAAKLEHDAKPLLPPHHAQPAKPRATNGHGHRHSSRHAAHKGRRPARSVMMLLAGPLKVALFTLWATATTGALVLDVLTDLFQSRTPRFPLVPVFALSIALTISAAFFSALLGRWRHKGFALFQPFAGGQRFVCMQAAGYTLASVSGVLKVVLAKPPALSNATIAATSTGEVTAALFAAHGTIAAAGVSAQHYRYGALTVLGCFTATAQLLLMLSLPFFHAPSYDTPSVGKQPQRPAKDKEQDEGKLEHSVSGATYWKEVLTPSLRRELMLLVLLLAVMTVSSMAAEHAVHYRRVHLAVILILTTVCLCILQLSLGPALRTGYRLYLPAALPWRWWPIHLAGNALLGAGLWQTAHLARLAMQGSVSDDTQGGTEALCYLSCGLLATLGVSSHLALLCLLQVMRGSRTEDASATTTTTATTPLTEEDYTSARYFTPAVSTALCALCSVTVYGLSWAMMEERGGKLHWAGGGRTSSNNDSSNGVSGGGGNNNLQHNLRPMQALLSTLLFALPPFTHLHGRFLHGTHYALWNPFGGNLEFIILQGIGWGCYACAIFFATLHLTETAHSYFLLLFTACLLICQCCLHASLCCYRHTSFVTDVIAARSPSLSSRLSEAGEEASPQASSPAGNDSSTTTTTTATSTSVRQDEGQHSLLHVLSLVLNGEMLLALMLALTSLVLRAVADGMAYHGKLATPRSHTRALLAVATFLSLLTAPLAQLSMRDHISLIRGASLRSSSGYAALQTISWSLYTLLVVRAALEWITGVQEMTLITLPAPYYAPGQNYVLLQHTYGGLLYILPVLGVLVSDLTETDVLLRHRTTSRLVRQAVHELQELMARHGAMSAAERQHSTRLLHIIAGPRLLESMNSNGSPTYAEAYPVGAGGVEVEEEDTASATGGGSEAKEGDVVGEGGDAMVSADEAAAAHSAARCVGAIMCLATFMIFLSATFLSEVRGAAALVFVATGMVILTLSCMSLHCVYGAVLHGHTGKYALFMPFAGGTPFMLRQALGWSCYTACLCLMIACLVERQGSRWIFAVMAVLSVLAQVLILHSVAYFDAAVDVRHTLIGRNAEGLLAAVTLLGTFCFCSLYDMAREGHATTQASSLVPVILSAISLCLSVPFGLSSLQRQAERYGLSPLALFYENVGDGEEENGNTGNSYAAEAELSERRASNAGAATTMAGLDGEEAQEQEETEQGQLARRKLQKAKTPAGEAAPAPAPASSPLGDTIMGDRTLSSYSNVSDAPTTPAASPRVASRGDSFSMASHTRQNSTASGGMSTSANSLLARSMQNYRLAVCYVITALIAIFVALLMPFTVVLLVYASLNGSRPTYAMGLQMLRLLSYGFAILVVLPVFINPIARRSRVVRDLHSVVACWSLYSIPTVIVTSGLAPPLLFHTRGALLHMTNMLMTSVISTLAYVHLISFVWTLACLAYFVYYYGYYCLYEHKASFTWHVALSDFAVAIGWVMYMPRFTGRPHITCRLRSQRAINFLKRHFVNGIAHYFSTRIIVADDYAPAATFDGPPRHAVLARVDLNVKDNQYLFSFHPHGVFPGTLAYLSITEQWERKVGHEASHFVTPHCADVVFAVPFMRELPLCLGSLSVARKGIETSLRAGNSPLIVTGGQSELILTRMCDTEMHLVCHHFGFVKLAMQHRVPLVPILSFAEQNVLDTVHMKTVQRRFLKLIGFPFPVLPYGRWYLPLPTTRPMTIVIGQPLLPLPGRESLEDMQCVRELHCRYFEQVEWLFYRYRAEAGYPKMVLYLHNGINDPGRSAELLPAEPGDELTHTPRYKSIVRDMLNMNAPPPS